METNKEQPPASALLTIWDMVNLAHKKLADTSLSQHEYNPISMDLINIKNELRELHSKMTNQ